MIALPAYIDAEVWAGFEEMRRVIKKPLTDRARKNVVFELHRIKTAGHCPNAALDQSINHCWADVYPAKEKEIERKATKTADGRIDAERAAAAEEQARVDAYIARTAGSLRRVA